MKKLKAMIAAGLISLSAPAVAQSDMMGMMHSQPMDGAMVMEPTDNLEMMFDMDVRLVNVRVVDSGNKPLSIGFKPMDGHARSFKVPVPALKPDNYTVHWTAMGEDGHRMSGSFQFMQH
ncbi:Copper resistance protein CopC [Marinobacterium lacunae]|uniref:Copper resistance protein CopC n=1 Tax=Marinobacterium lacunae TaxID=1232683 RepID=A0A081FYZ2_9GAMM|nr:copper resistance CopC family protein [Marinobacterium lacunae]KEA63747.1 Copper resistance protein CopC [Marinobacterium lacunae]